MKKIVFALLPMLLILISLNSCKKDDVKPKETVLYETDFSRSDDDDWWKTGNLGNGLIYSLKNGYYEMKSTGTRRGVSYNHKFLNGLTGTNMAVEASLKTDIISSSQPYNDQGGLLWNDNQNTHSYFYFEISKSGKYNIWGYPNGDDEDDVTYTGYTTTPAIHPGYNVLRIELTNGQLHFYINRQKVFSMEAINVKTLADVGLTVQRETTMQVDYFKTTELP